MGRDRNENGTRPRASRAWPGSLGRPCWICRAMGLRGEIATPFPPRRAIEDPEPKERLLCDSVVPFPARRSGPTVKSVRRRARAPRPTVLRAPSYLGLLRGRIPNGRKFR